MKSPLSADFRILVTIVLFTTFVGGAFADTISTAPARTTVQTASVDIEVIKFTGVGVLQSQNAYTIPTTRDCN